MTKRLEIIFLLASLILLAAGVVLFADIDDMSGITIDNGGAFAGMPATVSVSGGGAIKSGSSAGWDDPYSPDLWYPFENDRGVLTDVCVYGNDATRAGRPIWYASEQAYYIDVSDYFTIADDSSLSPTYGGETDKCMTVCCWINATDMTEFRMVSKWDNDAEWSIYTTADDKFQIILWDNDGHYMGRYTQSAITSLQNQWIHLAAVYTNTESNTGITLYTNGYAASSTGFSSGVYDGVTDGDDPVEIGKLGATYGDGYMSHVRIYMRNLSANEILAIYSSNRVEQVDTVSTNNLVLYLPMDQDVNVKNLGSATNLSGFVYPTYRDAGWSIIGTNNVVGINKDRVEHAETFDGVDDYIYIEDVNGVFSGITNGWSWSAWVYRDQNDYTETVFSKVNSDGSVADFMIGMGNDGSGVCQANVYEDGDSTIWYGVRGPDFNSADGWVHYAVTYDPPWDLLIYTNAIRADTTSVTNGVFTGPSYNSSAIPTIGIFNGLGLYFDGLLDDLRFYVGKVLTQPEIQTLKENTQKPNDSDENGY